METIHEEPGPPVKLPNADTINDTRVGYIPLHPSISMQGRKARILKDLHSSSLISLGQLSDDRCTTHLDDENLIVTKNNNVVLTGTRNHSDGLYDIPIYSNTHHPNPKTTIQEGNFKFPKLHSLLSHTAKPSIPTFPALLS